MSEKQLLGRPTIIENHPERDKINEEIIQCLLDGRSLETVAEGRDFSYRTVYKYVKDVFSQRAAAAIAHRDIDSGSNIIDRMEEGLQKVNKLISALDEWLTDPDDPQKYTLDPRDDEVNVVYLDFKESPPVKKRAKLQDLINDRVDNDKTPIDFRVSSADNRELLLKSVDRMSKLLELIARITGELKNVEVNVYNTHLYQQLQAVVLEVTEDLPRDVREKIARRLWERSGEAISGGSEPSGLS